MPYIPTPDEEAYLQACGDAITKGSEAASSAAVAGNGGEFSQFASGVKSLTDAYTAIKHGGNVSRHQGS